jgi:hypothetical protein
MEKLTKENFPRNCSKKQIQYLIHTGAGILRDFIRTGPKFSREEFALKFIPKSNKPTEMCNNLSGKPARLILQVLKSADMIITNKNGIEWTVLYTKKYGSVCGQEHYPFEDDMKGFLISYLENWTRTWYPSGTEESSFKDDIDIDSILGEPGILEPERDDPLKQNNVNDRHAPSGSEESSALTIDNDLDSINTEPGMLDPNSEQNNDGNIYNDCDDTSLNNITVDDSKKILTALTGNSPYDNSDVNIITPPANINNDNESGLSLMESTFPENKLLFIPNLNEQTTVSCLTPNSTAAAGPIARPIAWLKKKLKITAV